MNSSPNSFIHYLKPWISADLISEEYLQAIQQVAGTLPVLGLGCFECILEPDNKRVDLNVCINPRVNEHKTISQWPLPSGIYLNKDKKEIHEKIRTFCNNWAENNFFLKPLVGELWEIYDIHDPSLAPPKPWLYISFLKTALDHDVTLKAEIVLRSLVYLEPELPQSLLSSLKKALMHIPPGIRVVAVGAKKAETQTSIRLYVRINTFPELITFLQVQQWSGNIADLTARMQDWVQNSLFLGLILDFDGAFTPKIGIECHFEPEKMQEQLIQFTQKLSQKGLCSLRKKEALLKWNGYFNIPAKSCLWSWPDRLLNEPNRLPESIRIKRMIPYIKLVYESDKELVAKAYLGFYRPVIKN